MYFSLQTFLRSLKLNKRHTELTFRKGIFFWNGYTENFLDKCLRQI